MYPSQKDNLPLELTTKAKEFFPGLDFLKSYRLVREGRVALSFTKGSLRDGFIISGIIRDGRDLESRLTYRPSVPSAHLKSSCNCLEWTYDHHCAHILSLYLDFHLKSGEQDNFRVQDPLSARNLMSVRSPGFGQIVDGAAHLEGAPGQGTYAGLYYWIEPIKKSVPFPLPSPWQGELGLHFSWEKVGEIETLDLCFSYFTAEGKEVKEINIFENLYLFDWSKGQCWDLPADLKNFFRIFKVDQWDWDLEDFIHHLLPLKEKKYVRLFLEGQNYDELVSKDLKIRIVIDEASKKSSLTINLEFYIEPELAITPPKVFLLLGAGDGILGSFKKRVEGVAFLKSLYESLRLEKDQARAHLRTSFERKSIEETLHSLFKNQAQIIYLRGHKQLVHADAHLFRLIFSNLWESFGELSFKTSKWIKEEFKLKLDVPQVMFFDNVANFYERITPFGIEIFYRNKPVKSWSGQIRFERLQGQLDWFDLNLTLSQQDLQVLNAEHLSQGIALTSHGLILLTQEQRDLVRMLKRYAKLDRSSADSAANPDQEQTFQLRLGRSRILELFEFRKLGLDNILTNEEREICERLLSFKEIPAYPLPQKVADIARPYQAKGYQWLKFLFENKLGACLADDMGLGKTLQSIAFLQSVIDQIGRVLIVCPVSILINWQKEIEKFSDLEFEVYYGGGRSIQTDKKILITSYGVMKKEAEEGLKDVKFDVLILDEVQHLKNFRSLGASAARKINASFRICMTGTPVENDISEFYNILDLSLPGIWGESPLSRSQNAVAYRSQAKKTSRPFILRRTKAQVLADLPDKVENVVYLPFSPEEQARYERSLQSIRGRIGVLNPQRRYGEILKGLLELRQLCLWQKELPMAPTKIQFLMDHLEPILEEKHQVLIFSQFTSYLDQIQARLHEHHWKFSRIDGSQTFTRRQKEIEHFQSGQTPIFLISLKAGGVGLNLHQASYIFLMDPWWNPAVENQAIDRAHRIGQKNNLTVYRPIVKGSVEEKVLLLQQSKKELFRDLMAEDDVEYFSGKLTLEDFEKLLE